ncbi:MAG: putative TetR Transcriptional regulator [Streptosporangiaceae bacterium]|jgi:AcrR family transcriptional regulator|nr:putative TetR Transcriptional regulator [Streptosporangiaceae bacterium]
MGEQGGAERRAYHHGDLRAALIDAALDLISEAGVAGFSVAEAARRVGVSAAAPYRHFPDRESLLAAAASAATRQLTHKIRTAVGTAPDPGDPVERLAATAGVYSRFVIERRAGFDLIFTPALQDRHDGELRDATRALVAELLRLAMAASTGGIHAALELLEHHTALAHGYAGLQLGGAFTPGPPHPQGHDAVADHAVSAARSLIVGHRLLHAPADSGR